MPLFEIENVSSNGHVFVSLRGVQTLKPGQKKVVNIADADRYHPDIVALEGAHLKVTPVDEEKAKAMATEAKKAADKATEEKAAETKKAADAVKPVENKKA
jgi:hypothetical protein